MQTFLPYYEYLPTAKTLDYRRLGNQRRENKQIISAIEGITKGWRTHPATIMWEKNLDSLKLYANTIIEEWIFRGYKNTMEFYALPPLNEIEHPWWLGCEAFHASHRSNLLRKKFEFYSKFGWTEPDNLPYIWPSSTKP